MSQERIAPKQELWLREGGLPKRMMKVLTEGWGRMCHDENGRSDFCDLGPHQPEWEFFTWKAPRSRHVALIALEPEVKP